MDGREKASDDERAVPRGARPPERPPRPPRPSADEVDALGDEITQLAGQIAAATARFLELLGEFDALGGWGGVGIRSLAHWLSWRAGMDLRTAREHVRVARALRELPRTKEAFGKGELSFSKVRAISRVATGETEENLVEIARNSPAAHVERLVAGLRQVLRRDPLAGDQGGVANDEDHAEDGEAPAGPPSKPAAPPPQSLQWRWDEDSGDLVVWGRFGPADGRLLLAALTRAELERVRTLAHEADDEADDEAGERSVDRTAPPPDDAGPALVALAQVGLTVQDAPAFAPAAEVIYLHQDADEAIASASASASASTSASASASKNGSAEHPSPTNRQAVVSADDGPALDAPAADEVRCGARARCVVRGAGGAILAYGTSRRLFSATQLKALKLRDSCCRTPGCQRTRFLHAHHVVFWSEGGRTDLDNAVLLCSACHRSVHLGRLRIRALGEQRFEFVDASTGRVLQSAPPLFGQADQILADRTIRPRTITGGWEGQPLDLSLATSEVLGQWRLRRRWRVAGTPPEPWDGSDAA